MGRIVKVVGLVVGALLVLLVAVLVGVSLLFDPNDYKDRITTAVDDATGRSLTLEGDLSLNLFPRLGIGLGAAEFSNAEGFGDAPFARFESAELRVGLLPLLSRRLEIDRVMLSGLRLNLARDAQGRTNWDDLSGGAAPEEAAAPDADGVTVGTGDLAISVASVRIVDAEVTWQDDVTDQDWTLSNFNFDARDFDPGRSFPLEIGFDLAGSEVSVSVESEMRASIDLAVNRYRLEELSVDLEGEGTGWPGGSGEAHLEFASFGADLNEQSLELDGLELEMLGLNVSGNLVGENFLDDLSLSGGIEIDEFDPRDIMSVFDADIETADPDVLGRASASAQFYYDASSMGMRDMALALDDSTLTGSAGLAGERFEFALTVDSIDIDRYLPPAADESEAADDTGSVDEIDLPIDRLRNFSARGSLALNETRFLGMTFTDANFALNAANGRLALTPTGALYGGTLVGEIGIAVQGDVARFTLTSDLTSVDMAGVGRDYLKTEALEGTGSVGLNLASTGARVGEIKRG
ncbi:MAG: AsmA family protein, partial [Gammaproteobacteria bacterium]